MALTTSGRPKPPPTVPPPRRRLSRHLTETGVLVAAGLLVAGVVAGIVLSRQWASDPAPAGDGLAWLPDQQAGEAVQVNPSNGRPENRIPVADPGQGFLLAQAGGLLVVTTADGRLRIIDVATLATTSTFQGSTGTLALLDEHHLLAADLTVGTITALDPADGHTLATWNVGASLADATLDGQGDVWALRADGLLYRLTADQITDVTSPIIIGGAGLQARLTAHPAGVTVLAPDTAPGAGTAVRVGTAADTTKTVPDLTGAILAAHQAPVDLLPVSLVGRPTVVLVGRTGTVAVDTSPYGCDRPGSPAVHRDLARIPCLGAGRVIALDPSGAHRPPDIHLAPGTDPYLSVYNGWLYATNPNGSGTGIDPAGRMTTVSGSGTVVVAGPPPAGGTAFPNGGGTAPPQCPPAGCVTIPGGPPVPTAQLSCTSANGQFSCSLSYSPTTAGVIWFRDGAHQAAWDGDTAVSGACTAFTSIGVMVTNSAGSVSRSWASCVPPPAPTVPGAPGGVTVSFVSARANPYMITVNVSWSAANDGGSPITEYDVQVRASTGATFGDSVPGLSVTGVPLTCAASCANEQIEATIRAVNAAGAGPAAIGALTSVPLYGAQIPVTLQVTDGNSSPVGQLSGSVQFDINGTGFRYSLTLSRQSSFQAPTARIRINSTSGPVAVSMSTGSSQLYEGTFTHTGMITRLEIELIGSSFPQNMFTEHRQDTTRDNPLT